MEFNDENIFKQVILKKLQMILAGNYQNIVDNSGKLLNSDEIEINLLLSKVSNKLQEKEIISRFVPETVAELAKSNDGTISVGGSERKVTVLFSDIRNFTGMSEIYSPEQIVEMLNGYLEMMAGVVKRHGGVVDKFIGDSIMAVFYPGVMNDDEARAVMAAMQMNEELWRFNEEREAKNLFTIKIGIGINTGEVIAGLIGSSSGRLDYTVIGDTVNVAARLEGMSKIGGYTRIIISETTYKAVAHLIDVTLINADRVKGKENQVIMYEIVQFKNPELFIEGLKSPDEKVRYTSVNLMGLSGDPLFIANLLPCLKDTSSIVRYSVITALKNLMYLKENIVKCIFEMLNSETDEKIFSSLIAEVGMLGNDEDKIALTKYFGHDSRRVRANIIEAIIKISDKTKIILILKEKLNDPDNRNRANAAICCYNSGYLPAVQTLFEMCGDSENFLMRASGAYGLGEIYSREFMAGLIIENSPLYNLTEMIEENNSKMAHALEILENLLDDPEKMVRNNAARALGRIGNSAALKKIICKYLQIKKQKNDLKESLLAALKAQSDAKTVSLITGELDI